MLGLLKNKRGSNRGWIIALFIVALIIPLSHNHTDLTSSHPNCSACVAAITFNSESPLSLNSLFAIHWPSTPHFISLLLLDPRLGVICSVVELRAPPTETS